MQWQVQTDKQVLGQVQVQKKVQGQVLVEQQAQVFGHGWLCHPTSCRGRFSENFNLSTGFVIQGIKVQTLKTIHDSLF